MLFDATSICNLLSEISNRYASLSKTYRNATKILVKPIPVYPFVIIDKGDVLLSVNTLIVCRQYKCTIRDVPDIKSFLFIEREGVLPKELLGLAKKIPKPKPPEEIRKLAEKLVREYIDFLSTLCFTKTAEYKASFGPIVYYMGYLKIIYPEYSISMYFGADVAQIQVNDYPIITCNSSKTMCQVGYKELVQPNRLVEAILDYYVYLKYFIEVVSEALKIIEEHAADKRYKWIIDMLLFKK